MMASAHWLVCVFVMVILTTVESVQKSSTPCKTKSDAPLPHPFKCSLYYNCSIGLIDECIHPQLFNTDTQKCEHYSMVKCGKRKEPLNFCDYLRNAHSRGMPCSIDHPSCNGLADGLHEWPERKGSPYFVACDKERNVFQGVCKGGRLFDKDKGCYRPWCTGQ